MKRRNQLIVMLLAVSVLAGGCGNASVEKKKDTTIEKKDTTVEKKDTTTEKKENTQKAADIDPTTGTPWIDSNLYGAIKENMEFDVKDDFAAAVNKEWNLGVELKEDEKSVSPITDIDNITTDQIKKLLTDESLADQEEIKKLQNCYQLLIDWDTRDETGIEPIMPVVEKIKEINTLEDLNGFLTLPSEERDGVSIIDTDVWKDLNDVSRNLLWIMPPGLMLEDSAEYDKRTELGERINQVQTEVTEKMLKKIGFSEEESKKIMENSFKFEEAIAGSIMTTAEGKKSDAIERQNNLITYEKLKKEGGNVPVTQIILSEGYQEAEVQECNLSEPQWLKKLNELYTEEHVDEIRDYLLTSYVRSNMRYLDRESYEWAVEASNQINGTKGIESDEDMATEMVREMLGGPTAKAYCDTYFTQEDKDKITELAESIVAEYRDMLKNEEFLSDDTKEYAIEKLDNLQLNILYPEEWPDYSDIQIKSKDEGGTVMDAIGEVNAFDKEKDREKLHEKNKQDGFNEQTLPTEVACYNDIYINSINIMAAYCQGENYNQDMSTEELYAKMGFSIGHAISHAFDSLGAQFDKEGNMANWWTEEDLKLFKEKNEKIAEYYNKMSPWSGAYVDGSIVTSAAGTDMASMKCMLLMAEKIPDFDYDEFFRAFAEGNRQCATIEYQQTLLKDGDLFKYLRVNTVLQQFDKFFETYDIKEGDGMYLAPEDRVIIW